MKLKKVLTKIDEFYVENHLGETVEQLAKDLNVEISVVESYVVKLRDSKVREPSNKDTALFKTFARAGNATAMTSGAAKLGELSDTAPRIDPNKVCPVKK